MAIKFQDFEFHDNVALAVEISNIIMVEFGEPRKGRTTSNILH